MTAADAQARLKSLANPANADFHQRYFKTGKGEYGEGDVFLGIKVPVQRTVAKAFRQLPLDEIETLLTSKIHEHRAVALMIMVEQFKKSDDRRQAAIHKRYLANRKHINNWDLIDASSPTIVGQYLFGKSTALLLKFVRSKHWNERRIAMLATQYFIRQGEFGPTLELAELLLKDEHDLLHKAAGWMLREVGDRDPEPLRRFLRRHVSAMPRTMLRYAIEKLTPAERKKWMSQ